MHPARIALRRPYQDAVLNEFIKEQTRLWALLWERQAGKSTTMADFALYEMFRCPNRTVIYASASLLLAQELPIRTAIRASQTISQLVENDAHTLKRFADSAQSVIDTHTQKPVPPTVLAELLNQLHQQDLLRNPDPVQQSMESESPDL